MKLKSLFSALLLGCAMMAQAQSANDPTIMTINGQPISRSEFEYSYNKNNSEGVIDKKSVEEYVDLFINYKLIIQPIICISHGHLNFLLCEQMCGIPTSNCFHQKT